MGTYRGLNISGGLRANFKKLRVKKTIDEMEISDRGAITGTPSDLTTKGAGHRRGRNNNQRRGARGATRESVDYGFITGADSNIVQEHDYGTVIETTTSLTSAAFETRRSLGLAASIADEETAVAPTAALPGSVSLYNSTGIIPAGTPLILNGDGTVSAVTGGSYQGAGLSTTYDNPNSSGDLGRSASISDTYVAATDANSGTVSVFNRETGTHIRTHTKSADSSERWGWYVDNSDEYVVVGDASPDYARQVLDVWRLSDGASMTTIYYPTNGNNMFPGSLAINGNKILAGAYQTPSQNPGTGAYLWNAQNGSLLRSYSRDIADAAHFGRAVTMNSTYAFVWSPRWYPQSLGYAEVPAKVHMFTFTSNNAVNRYPISWFGGSSQAEMDCDETHVIIGGAGKAGIIDIATGNLVREFTPPDGEAGSSFGLDVSIDGDYAAVSGSGKVFVYDVTTGDLLDTLQDPDGNALTFYQQVIRARSNGDILVANRSAANGGKVYKYTIGEIQTTNLTDSNFIGFAGSEFSYDGSLGQVISFGGTVDNFTGLTVGETYYVQNDGSISLVPSDVVAGTAVSTTAIQVHEPVTNYSYEGSTYTIGQSSGTFTGGAQSVAVTNDGNTVFQGFPYNMTPNEESGGLEIYTKDEYGNWSVSQSIAPPLEGAANSFKWRFGATVRVTEDGNRMVTMRTGGVSGYSPGKFYVYDKNETSGLYELTASHQHYSDASMNNQRFDKSTGYNGLDMSPDGTLIMIHHMKYTGSSYENWAIVYRLDENDTYQYTDKIQMPISGSQGSMSGASQWSPVDMSTSGHLVWAHPTWNSFGKAAYAYYDLDTGNKYSGILNPGATVSAFGRDVAMAKDGSVCAVLDPQFPTGGVAPNKAGAVFIYKWDEQNKTYNFSERLTANSVSMPDAIEQATGIQFNQDGTQLYVKKSGNVAIFAPDENGNYILSQDLPNSFVSSYYGSFDFSTNMAYMICGGSTFGVHGGTSGGAATSSGNLPTASSGTWYGDRIMVSGGRTSSKTNSIQYLDMSTGGTATSFGSLLESKTFATSCSDSTYCYIIGGQTDTFGHSNLLEYKTFSTNANTTKYGDLTGYYSASHAGSNGGTGVFWHQASILGNSLTGIDWFTLGTPGNSSNLGNLSASRSSGGACADATYFVVGQGNQDGVYGINTTEYLAIATGGEATIGGTLSHAAQSTAAGSNATKGAWMGGYKSPNNYTTVSVLTLSNPANNGSVLGNLTLARRAHDSTASADKAIAAGGYSNAYSNVVDYLDMESGGTATDLGDLQVARVGGTASTGNAS